MTKQEGIREGIELELSQYASSLLAWKSWGMSSGERVHNLKIESVENIINYLHENDVVIKGTQTGNATSDDYFTVEPLVEE